MTYGVTDNGFVKKTLEESLAEIQAEYQTAFGENVDLAADQPLGQLAGIQAKREADLWDLAAEMYTSRNPAEATGISLDNIASETALQRLPATPTAVTGVWLIGDVGTIIPAGSLTRQSTTGIQYSLNNEVTIDNTNARFAAITVNASPSFVYTLTIDGESDSYTSQPSDGIPEILAGLLVVYNNIATNLGGNWSGSGAIVNNRLEVSNIVADFEITIVTNMTFDEVASAGNFTSQVNGANPLIAGALDDIPVPITGWNRVTNPTAGVTGRSTESDAELRVRRELAVSATGNATDEAIRSNLINDIPEINFAIVNSNRESVTVNDVPAHNVEIIVTLTSTTEAVLDSVAMRIWTSIASGIPTFLLGNPNPSEGRYERTILDSQNNPQIIRFSTPADTFIYFRVTLSKNAEGEIYPSDGDQQVKDAMIAYAIENINIGQDVYPDRFCIPVFSVPGISAINIEIFASETDGSIDPGTITEWVTTPIEILSRRQAQFATSRILVQDA